MKGFCMKNVGHICNPKINKYCAEGANPDRHDTDLSLEHPYQHGSHQGGCICPIGDEIRAERAKQPELGTKAWVPVIDSEEGFTLGLATVGEPGYRPLKPENRMNFKTYDEANEAADGLNERLGLTPEQASKVMIDSVKRQHDR